MEFKIENAIPIPETEEPELEEIEPEETSTYRPFKCNSRKCRGDKHSPMVGRCTLCGDVFPCPSGNCGHSDCADPSIAGLDCPGNGTSVPEG